ncbi:MAG: preprotein translocase subunit SecA [Pseudomonadota bacterium]|nr:preprotein translocase subunit SecA [Pseudomonadota bacterium]
MSTVGKILTGIFGSRNSRTLKKLKPITQKIDEFGETLKPLSDDALKAYTETFKDQLSNGKTLDDIMPEAFAVVREASHRVLGMRHFNVQLLGGIALHKGWIAEAKTGEGKTLMATLPSYLNALTGEGVHVIVPNSYLAKRDAEWMGKIHTFLGLSVAAVQADDDYETKQKNYQSDIIYTTNHAIGFDYLRDNMRVDDHAKLIRSLNYCIVDEVDSILIDDARTPLIITGPADTSSELYEKIYQMIKDFPVASEEAPGDVEINLQDRQVFLSDSGQEHIQKLLIEANIIAKNTTLFDLENTNIAHYINACLQARHLFQKDIEYVVDKDEVVIIEESTGRKAIGRRWGNGIHQALEAKESVSIKKETQTLASITYQNLFRQYHKLSGMTGTADTEAAELKDIYGLDVLVIPTNKPMARTDLTDMVFLSHSAKTNAIVKEIKTRHETGQPILIGTASIEYSEQLSDALTKQNITHQVLNAKQHEREAEIIADAGRLNAVTIATNMAGRGTDIMLGGCPDHHSDWKDQHDQVLKAGGLHVLGTERHESRRVDNQLRGRSGRQGDVGSSQFYLSFDDRLIKRFASEKVISMLRNMGDENEAISAPILSRQIENAQKRVESKYYDARKELLKLDDVANHQRQIIYNQRNELLQAEHISEIITGMISFTTAQLINRFIGHDLHSASSVKDLEEHLQSQYNIHPDLSDGMTISDLTTSLNDTLQTRIDEHKKLTSEEMYIALEKQALLMVLDRTWKEHLSAMDHLKRGINYRSYAQKNPAHEFKKDSFALFEQMLEKIKLQTIRQLCLVQIKPPPTTITPGGYDITMSPKKAYQPENE